MHTLTVTTQGVRLRRVLTLHPIGCFPTSLVPRLLSVRIKSCSSVLCCAVVYRVAPLLYQVPLDVERR